MESFVQLQFAKSKLKSVLQRLYNLGLRTSATTSNLQQRAVATATKCIKFKKRGGLTLAQLSIEMPPETHASAATITCSFARR